MEHEADEPLDQEQPIEREEPIDQEELAGVVEAVFAEHSEAHQFRLRSVEVIEGTLEAVFLGRPADEANGPYGARLPAPKSVDDRVAGGGGVEGGGQESGTLTAWVEAMLLVPVMRSYDAGRAGVRDREVLWLDLEP